MLNFSPEKLLIVGVLAVIVLGPNRLPAAARSVGHFVSTFRRISSGFQEEVRDALAEPKEAFDAVVGEFRPPDVRRSVRDAISTTLIPPAQSEAPADGDRPEPVQQAEPPDTPRSLGAPDNPTLN